MNSRTGYRVALLAGWVLLLPCSAWGSRQERDSDRIEVTASRIDEHARVELLIRDKLNALRVQHGLPELRAEESLTQAAHYFVYFMAETGEYGHEADGARPADRAANYGYEYCIVAENIAFFETPVDPSPEELAERLHQAWFDSPEHRDNLLDTELAEIGVAVARSTSTGAWYAVQKFGRPRSMQIEFTIENPTGESVSYRIGEREYELPPGFSRRHFRCRSGELELDEAGAEAVEYASGAEYRIARRNGSLTVEAADR